MLRRMPRAHAALVAVATAVAAAAVAAAGPVAGGAPWLGVVLEPGSVGVRVGKVVPGSPAEDAGLVEGDEIVALGAARTRSARELVAAVAGHRVGDRVAVAIVRDGRRIAVHATLGPRLGDREVLERWLVDRPAPDFALDVASGAASGALADYAGRVVVIEFFATWCRYCPLAHRALAQLAARHPGDVAVLGIAGGDRKALAAYLSPKSAAASGSGVAVLHHGPLGFAALYDDKDAVKRAYLPVVTYPTIVVIDRRGFVRAVAVGASSAEIGRAVRIAEALARE